MIDRSRVNKGENGEKMKGSMDAVEHPYHKAIHTVETSPSCTPKI